MSEIHDYKFEFVFHGCDMVAACSVMEWLVSEADNGGNNLGGGFHVDEKNDVRFELVVEGITPETAEMMMWVGIGRWANLLGHEYEGGFSVVDDIENGRGKAALRRDSYDMPKSA
jgi:hypothetical protein